jgi:hypothetical protein
MGRGKKLQLSLAMPVTKASGDGGGEGELCGGSGDSGKNQVCAKAFG